MNTTTAPEPEKPHSALSALLTLEEKQATDERIFPSVESLRWYLRQHREGLEGCGALLRIQGRLWVQPQAFDAYVLRAGQQAALRRQAAA